VIECLSACAAAASPGCVARASALQRPGQSERCRRGVRTLSARRAGRSRRRDASCPAHGRGDQHDTVDRLRVGIPEVPERHDAPETCSLAPPPVSRRSVRAALETRPSGPRSAPRASCSLRSPILSNTRSCVRPTRIEEVLLKVVLERCHGIEIGSARTSVLKHDQRVRIGRTAHDDGQRHFPRTWGAAERHSRDKRKGVNRIPSRARHGQLIVCEIP